MVLPCKMRPMDATVRIIDHLEVIEISRGRRSPKKTWIEQLQMTLMHLS